MECSKALSHHSEAAIVIRDGQQHPIPETAKPPATNHVTKTKAGKCVNNTTINH
jgi:hypothetical protein